MSGIELVEGMREGNIFLLSLPFFPELLLLSFSFFTSLYLFFSLTPSYKFYPSSLIPELLLFLSPSIRLCHLLLEEPPEGQNIIVFSNKLGELWVPGLL